MANVQIKFEKLTPFGGIFPILEQLDAFLAQTIDSTLGMRCKWYGYQYSEILRSLMCVYLCGGSCIEDVTTHLMRHLSLHPSLRTCSADTILRAIEELTCENTTYQSASGRVYDFNTADKMNSLSVNAIQGWVDILRFQHFYKEIVYGGTTQRLLCSPTFQRTDNIQGEPFLKNKKVCSTQQHKRESQNAG